MNGAGLKTPYVTVDAIIRYQGGIVLIERKNEPHGWALPGGFVEIGESARRSGSEGGPVRRLLWKSPLSSSFMHTQSLEETHVFIP